MSTTSSPNKYRHSSVLSSHASVASSNPLVSDIGAQILRAGGNAADACVAMAAALNVTQPYATGLGGDCFCLFYDGATKEVKGLNGSGRSSAQFTLDMLSQDGITASTGMPAHSAHTVTVPGAAAGWVDTIENFGSGKLSLKTILAPAITLAEQGFPVSLVAAQCWVRSQDTLITHNDNPDAADFLLDGHAPGHGDIMKFPKLAETFKILAEHGKGGFYQGRIAEAIVNIVQTHGGTLSMNDLASHTSTQCHPISTTYHGVRVWEIPPNGQGMTVLIALNILEHFHVADLGHNSTQYVHLVSEALRLAFADSLKYCADPDHVRVPVQELLSKEYAESRKQGIDMKRCAVIQSPGFPTEGSDTVYLTAVDSKGNACSFINSTFCPFGSGLVPRGCGFTLQNRGLNFSLTPGHNNCAAPCKRPYHTIIPAMATCEQTGELYASFGVMGGFMQPQGHVQVLLNMIDFGMDPQDALDQPRFRMEVSNVDKVVGNKIMLEAGLDHKVGQGLAQLGYDVESDVTFLEFGRGQIVQKKSGKCQDNKTQCVYWAGSDQRGDGIAIGF